MSLDSYGHSFGVALDKIAKSFERIAAAQELQAKTSVMIAMAMQKTMHVKVAAEEPQPPFPLMQVEPASTGPLEMD